jgi:DNA-binding SARP family transcriptional activator
MDDRWQIELLGGLRLSRSGRSITHFRTRKTGVLLAYLASCSDRTHPRDELVELLWPDASPEDGRNSLSQAISWLRREIDPAGPADAEADGAEGKPTNAASGEPLLVADRTTARLNAHAFTTDVAQFAAALHGAAQAADGAQRARWLTRAMELYRGELLPGCFEPWVLQERAWLAEQYFQALGQLLVELERMEELQSALNYARHGVSMDPLREEAHRNLIRIYVASGQPDAARRQYRELERLLERELDDTPEAASRTLIREIEALPSAGRPIAGRSAPAVLGASMPPGELPPVDGALPVDSVFYIVRPTDASFHAAVEHRESIVQIQAPRQMGKSSLLAQGLQRAREAGARVAYSDLQVLDRSDLRSVERLFLTLSEWLADQLDLDVLPHQVYNPYLGPSVNFERYVRREVLAKSAAPLVWGLDGVNRLFASDCGGQVLALFHSWHNRRGLDPAGPWDRLTLVMTYATGAAGAAATINPSPLQVGARLTLSEFTLEEGAELNRRYDSPLRSPAEVARLHSLSNGHPYRMSRALWELASRDVGSEVFMAPADPQT